MRCTETHRTGGGNARPEPTNARVSERQSEPAAQATANFPVRPRNELSFIVGLRNVNALGSSPCLPSQKLHHKNFRDS